MGRALVLALVAAALAGAVVSAQRRGLFQGPRDFSPDKNAAYDGRFTFARLKYEVGPGGYYYCGLPAWAHGYQSCEGGERAETSLMKIVNELSFLNAHEDEGEVLAVDDPELFKYPISYMTEAGFWELTDDEAAAFRAYLHKGGFVIFDDFRDPPRGGGGWEQFESDMRRVLPGSEIVDLDPSMPIFHAFFEIKSFDVIPQAYDFVRPKIRGIFEDNDPKKRLIAIINFDTDVSQYWEFLGTGFRPVDEANEAYKLGVNYLIYGMTH